MVSNISYNTSRALRMFYKVEDSNIKGYVDACYLSDPHKEKSQTCYVILRQGATIP
jgi:hypothetical protein